MIRHCSQTGRVSMTIRLANVEDAAALDHFFQQLDRETCFMLYEAGERPSDVEGQRQRLAAMRASPNQRMWLLSLGGEVQGFAVLLGGNMHRNRHCALVVMGLRPSARGQGWGERLLRTLIDAASDLGINRLELGVMAHNEVAHSLYRKCGFRDEGLRRQAYQLDEGYVDEISMGLLLPSEAS
ncbi:GNAT family N-acetyltransferase [Aeromonas salmonicida]|uniref:GNAT family N-acetyltransferase n=1 Tax=Aeromonas salmonicida TaxID=645 RepID=UPI00223EA343|nr:GNAT family N-acetyltransferase [Aeromonas salmonicida]